MQAPADEEDAIRARFWHPRAGEVVIDVGSFEGTYTLPSLLAGATVYAIDGRSHTLQSVRELAEANQAADRLTLLHRTVYDGGPYPVGLARAIASSPYESSRDMAPDGPPTTIDQLVGELGLTRLDWVKVDVEGGELGVLYGARGTLLGLRPTWLIEDHSRIYPWVAEQDTTHQLMELLERADYDVEHVEERYVDYVVGRAR